MSRNLALYMRKVSKSSLQRRSTLAAWQPTIGLEVHAQLNGSTKLFAPSPTAYASPPNTATTFHDIALPGTLPVLSEYCVHCALKTAIALEATINHHSTFDRKHYFYADLPAGYQITQQYNPIAKGGFLNYMVRCNTTNGAEDKKTNGEHTNGEHTNGETTNGGILNGGRMKATPQELSGGEEQRGGFESRRIHLVQIQLEQDSGKSLHDAANNRSLIDFNRAGLALLEIITAPELTSSEEAASFVKELLLVLKMIGVCDGRMEEGSLRVDASVSVARDRKELGTRTEVKNLNSIRSIRKAIDHEVERQIGVLESGGSVANQTLFFDANTDTTAPLRDKETLHDYRFLPEPNLTPLVIPPSLVRTLCHSLPPLPCHVRQTLVSQDGLSLEQSTLLVAHPDLLHLYTTTTTTHPHLSEVKKRIGNFIINDLQGILHKHSTSISEMLIPISSIAELMEMLLLKKNITLQTACQVLECYLTTTPHSIPPSVIVKKNSWYNITDHVTVNDVCRRVLKKHPKAVTQYRGGKKKLFNFLVGRVRMEMGGRVDGHLIDQTLKELLHEKQED